MRLERTSAFTTSSETRRHVTVFAVTSCGFSEQIRGSTPLHVAASRLSADFLPIVILLLHAGAWVDALDNAGKTPQQLCTRQVMDCHTFTGLVEETNVLYILKLLHR